MALRGQSPERAIGLLMQMSGNKALGGAGEGFVSDAQKQAMMAQQAPLVQAETATKQYGITPQASLGGVTPSAYELLTKRQQVPKYQPIPFGSQGVVDVRTGQVKQTPGGMGSYSSDAVDALARKANATGKIELPQGVRGPAAYQLGQQVLERMLTLDPNANLAERQASYHGDTGSLASQQKILDNAESWERTGKANLNVLLGVAHKLHDTGSPWLNAPVRSFAEKGFGDPNFTAFKAAHATVVNEYAKILSGSQGSAAVTDSARKEADSMLPLDATWEQLAGAARVLDTDAGNRIGAARQQVSNIKGRLGGGVAAQQAAPQAPTDTAALRKKYGL